jgi:drug/metabolite transporter (DMT)-like permease
MALPGIWWVSRESADVGTVGGDSPTRGGLIDAVLAGLGFGGLFVCLNQIADDAGVLPLAVNQVVAGVVIVAIAVATRRPWVPRERHALLGLAAGALAGMATAAFLAATHTGYLAVAAVVTSLYPGVTVLLAAFLLRERLNRPQRLGLILCLAAIVLVAAPTQSR